MTINFIKFIDLSFSIIFFFFWLDSDSFKKLISFSFNVEFVVGKFSWILSCGINTRIWTFLFNEMAKNVKCVVNEQKSIWHIFWIYYLMQNYRKYTYILHFVIFPVRFIIYYWLHVQKLCFALVSSIVILCVLVCGIFRLKK